MNTDFITIQNLSKVYPNGRQALNNINLTIYEAEILALLGVNGAGKTTLSSIIATLHPPTTGDVLFKGKSIYKDIMSYRLTIGYCPQKPNLDPYLNVRDNLVFAGRYYLMSEKVIQQRVDQLMEQFGLNRYATAMVDELSGGWKQRLLIARALVHSPQLVIFDEPTVGLDPDIRRQLWQIIADLKKSGITIILTTHYLDEAEALADRACILHKGHIVLTESISSLKAQHQRSKFEDIFIDITQQEDSK